MAPPAGVLRAAAVAVAAKAIAVIVIANRRQRRIPRAGVCLQVLLIACFIGFSGVCHFISVPVLPCGARCERPSWSPLGDQIAFTCGKDRPFNICTLNMRTNQVQQLLPVDGFSNEQPVFSPNGKHIAFKTDRWGKDQIAIIDTKGKIQRRVTDAGTNTFPTWSRSKG